MAINRWMRAALRALSYPDLDIRKNYELERQMVAFAHFYAPRPQDDVWDTQIEVKDRTIPLRVYPCPAGQLSHGVLLFFHGGGWVTGSVETYNRVCINLAREMKHTVVSVDYRLAPEHRFPCALQDCYAAARSLFSGEGPVAVKPEDITLIGDSAGGNLAAAVSLMAKDTGEFTPLRQILLYPCTYYDHSPDSLFDSVRENGEDYLLTAKRVCEYQELYGRDPSDYHNPYFSPLLAKEPTQQPATLVLTAEYDPLRDEGEAYAEKLRRYGNYVEAHRIPDALHGYFSLPPHFSIVRRSYRYINRFLREVPKLEG